MIHTAVIIQDPAGYSERCRALQQAHPHAFAVSPEDKPYAHTLSVTIPDEWLPADLTISFSRRCWHRGYTLGLAAVQKLAIDADYYWFIESDCVASQERWKALFASHVDNEDDCVSNPFRSRAETKDNFWWTHPGTPDWATHFYVPACHRLSRRAVAELIRTAEETRECFCEHALASTIVRAGFTFSSANDPVTHWNRQTYRFSAEAVIRNPNFLCHPVKENSFGP